MFEHTNRQKTEVFEHTNKEMDGQTKRRTDKLILYEPLYLLQFSTDFRFKYIGGLSLTVQVLENYL